MAETERQRYVALMEYQDLYGQTKGLPKYTPNWRDTIDNKFDAADGRKIVKENTVTLKQGLRDIKLFQGVKEVWADSTCPNCGERDYFTWDLVNIDNDMMLNTCEHCGEQYVMTLKNTKAVKWVK